jgi:hypothetical protein
MYAHFWTEVSFYFFMLYIFFLLSNFYNMSYTPCTSIDLYFGHVRVRSCMIYKYRMAVWYYRDVVLVLVVLVEVFYLKYRYMGVSR